MQGKGLACEVVLTTGLTQVEESQSEGSYLEVSNCFQSYWEKGCRMHVNNASQQIHVCARCQCQQPYCRSLKFLRPPGHSCPATPLQRFILSLLHPLPSFPCSIVVAIPYASALSSYAENCRHVYELSPYALNCRYVQRVIAICQGRHRQMPVCIAAKCYCIAEKSKSTVSSSCDTMCPWSVLPQLSIILACRFRDALI